MENNPTPIPTEPIIPLPVNSAAPTTQTIPGMPNEPVKKNNLLKIISLLILGLFLVFLVSVGTLYYLVVRPRVIFVSALSKTLNSSSLNSQINFEAIDKSLSNMAINYDKNGNLSKIAASISIQKENPSAVENITLSLIDSVDYSYFKPEKSNSTQTLNQLLTDHPELASMKGFIIVQPVLFGKSWLKMKNAPSDKTKKLSPLQSILVGTAVTFPLIINSFQNSFKFNGNNYKKIVIGVNKNFLTGIVTDAKTNNNYYTDSDKTNLLNMITNTNGWDKDILEILVDDNNYVSDVILKLPRLAGEIKDISFSDFEENKVNTTEYVYQTLINYTNQQVGNGENIKIAEARFGKFNENIGIETPSDIVDFDSQTKEDQNTAFFTLYSIIFNQKLNLTSKSQSNLFSTKSHETKLLFDQGNNSQMLISANEMLKLAGSDNDKAISYYWIGLAYYGLKDMNSAEQNLNTALSLKSKYAPPYVTLAAISYQKGEYQKGLDQSLKCAEAESDYAWCYNDIGLGYLYLGNRDLGIKNLEKAVVLDPLTFIFNDNLNRAKKSQ